MSTHPTNDGTGIRWELLFSTPLITKQWEDAEEINAHLRALFLARESVEGRKTSHYSNVGGWHSPIDLQESWDHQLRTVLERCRTLAEEATVHLLGGKNVEGRPSLTLSAWANVSREGDYNVPHVHETAWSAVYYVCVPPGCTGDGAGALELIDPRSAVATANLPGPFFATRRVIVPKPGLMVLFPGSVMHFVHPFRGEGERISIACDLAIDRIG